MSEPAPIHPIYRREPGEDRIVLYVGDLEVGDEANPQRVPGQVELSLFPKTELVAKVEGPTSTVGAMMLATEDGFARIRVPRGVEPEPPGSERFEAAPRERGRGWFRSERALEPMAAGDIADARRFVIHLTGALQARIRTGVSQGQIAFSLDGWELRFALTVHEEYLDDRDFGAVIEAVPPTELVVENEVDRLTDRLFHVLSLVANREVGVGPVCGLDVTGRVVWAEWGPPRARSGRTTLGWCPPHLVPQALPEVAARYERELVTRSWELIVERAINVLCFCDGSEVLDVRIPMACSGIELLSWGVLRREGLADQQTIGKITAAAAARLLVGWAGLPLEIPAGFDALERRARASGKRDVGGPEILFDVRNSLIHPPKSIDDPEWPDGEELFEAWKLGTWYLELLILRVLGYRGSYWSRLEIARSDMETETVPWAAGQANGH
ncbi:hypothetical protein HJD18_08130 [Thermoleophilia bacterium SCSIO 60948]|nr:hypothetical protein HJD18_08130 [Thermoleophilia bacterium SCSIO 60948]